MYKSITNNEIDQSQPVKNTTLDKIKENLDDHELRLQNVEGGGSVYPPIILSVNGPYSLFGAQDGVVKTTANFSFNITGVRILVKKAGTDGDLTIDIKRKRASEPYESIFTSLPSISHLAGDNSLSSNTILNSAMVDVQVNDILRLDITTVQTGGEDFLVRIDYNRTAINNDDE